MAEFKSRVGSKMNPMDDVKWIIGILIVVGIAWYATGGLNSERASKGPFLKPPAPLSTGEAYGKDIGAPLRNRTSTGTGGASTGSGGTSTGVGSSPTTGGGATTGGQASTDSGLESQFSKLRGKIVMESVKTGSLSNATDEYIVLSASRNNTESVPITGLTFQSVPTGKSVTVGRGISLPMPGQASGEEAVYLRAGKRVYVITGRSPTGQSFQLNKCTGYFEQFQNFIPSLPRSCPHPSKEILPEFPNNLDDTCLTYLEKINSCEVIVSLPRTLSDSCELYLEREISYNKCVEKHRSDKDFFSGEWRLYLARDNGLWKTSRETIRLLDQSGKIIDERSY